MKSNLLPTYNQFPIELVDGHDWHLIDSKSKEYVDFTSGIGVCNLGYSNEKVKNAVADQFKHIWHTSNLYHNSLAEKVAGKLCPENYLAFFCNSGTEANEAAFKIARRHTGKHKMVAFNNGFHGRTYGSLSVTGYPGIQKGFQPLVPDVSFGNYNDDESLKLIDRDTAAVILEVIQGEGGINVGKKTWLQKVEQKCHQTKTMLIVDEVQSGMGRTGYKFAFEADGLHPDIITSAKGLANGLPVGAMMAKKEMASAFGPGSHGNTFGGNKVVMASANAVLDQLTPDFLYQVKVKGKFLSKQLHQKIEPLPNVKSVSGKGLMIGIHLDPSIKVSDVITKLQGLGLLTLSARGNTLRLLPPLIISEEAISWGLDQIVKVIHNENH
ncbi:acetylornithine aminotransferase [Philodulcilactobacillus myokoensis]|uniref:Acetylornithine aminotransferase n=1 Tax=Philodulcilactobacillus myokoensis TaxID=2929573 RepID=A0A9W6ETI7_9LACO|nr:acetylornithine transaminase [Philodulcilactobacillus myokoensis]GLB47422.1 acetylornithine aminotransferase [Philodulcilactobacillus myokoensis]